MARAFHVVDVAARCLLLQVRMKKKSGAETRKRKASVAVRNGNSGSLTKRLALVDFREPTEGERIYGRSLARRASQLKDRKRRTVVGAR
jgi:hypothetical protein